MLDSCLFLREAALLFMFATMFESIFIGLVALERLNLHCVAEIILGSEKLLKNVIVVNVSQMFIFLIFICYHLQNFL